MVQAQSSSAKESEAGQFFVPKLDAPGLSIRINLSLIEDLGFATIEGLKSVPKRGLEIGGILLGRLDAAQSTILIEDHEAVESEHLHGPSWLLSPKDRSAFRRTLDRLRNRGPRQPLPVGFYRSQTRDGLGFDDQDNSLMREMFASEPALCLLVKPSLAEPSVAQLGMMTDHLLQPVAAFPFHAGVLREGDFQILNGSPPVMIPAKAPPPPQPVSTRAPRVRGPIPPTATLLAIAAAILLCAFLIARYRTHLRPAAAAVKPAVTQPTVPDNALLLNVQRQNGTAILTWNHDAAPVKSADYAQLLISDGRNREQLQLSKTELQAGRVVYIPHSRDINFQLQLFAQFRSTAEESIRSVVDVPAPPPSEPQTHPSLAVATPPRRDEAEPTPEPPAYNNAPEPTPAPPPAVAQPAPPQETAAPPPAPKPNPFPEPDKTPPKPREPEVATTVSLEFIGPSGVRNVLDTLSPRRIFGFGSDKTTPPRIIRQILPGIYPALASRIHGTRLIDVKITISAGGQVVKTELLDGPAADPIDSAVYYAARQWTFEPARTGNRPVESKVLMHFVLKRSS